jgi:hypothetical protein
MAYLNYINGEWVENYKPTIDDLSILRGADSDEKALLLNRIKTTTTPLQKDVVIANELYQSNFPEGYDFISCSVDTLSRSGLINCRIGEEHKQIRF